MTEFDFPEADVARDMYRRDVGNLTEEWPFAPSPFQNDQMEEQCEQECGRQIPPLDYILNQALCKEYRPLQQSLQIVIDLTRQHCT